MPFTARSCSLTKCLAALAVFVCGGFPSSRTLPAAQRVMPADFLLAAAHMAGLAVR